MALSEISLEPAKRHELKQAFIDGSGNTYPAGIYEVGELPADVHGRGIVFDYVEIIFPDREPFDDNCYGCDGEGVVQILAQAEAAATEKKITRKVVEKAINDEI